MSFRPLRAFRFEIPTYHPATGFAAPVAARPLVRPRIQVSVRPSDGFARKDMSANLLSIVVRSRNMLSNRSRFPLSITDQVRSELNSRPLRRYIRRPKKRPLPVSTAGTSDEPVWSESGLHRLRGRPYQDLVAARPRRGRIA